MSVSLVKLSPVDMYARPSTCVATGAPTFIDYMATRPVRSVQFGARVMVPVWHNGDVIGWAPGTVDTVRVYTDEHGDVSRDSVTVTVHIDGTAPGDARMFYLYSLQDIDASPNY